VRSVLLECGRCSHQTSVTAGTILQDTRQPLTDWFRAMVRPGRDRLRGRVEVDETFTGGVEEGARGVTHPETQGESCTGEHRLEEHRTDGQEDGPGIGRIRMRCIPDASVDSLTDFITEVIEPRSTVHTDGWRGYAGVEVAGYDHEVTYFRGRKKTASELMPRPHRVASLLKRHPPGGLRMDVFWCTTSGDLRVCCQRWLLGTHPGAVAPEHLDYYLTAADPRIAESSFSPGAAGRRHQPVTSQVSDPVLAPRRFGCQGRPQYVGVT
jgi:hypothetical protein